jgi:hypothetical protein
LGGNKPRYKVDLETIIGNIIQELIAARRIKNIEKSECFLGIAYLLSQDDRYRPVYVDSNAVVPHSSPRYATAVFSNKV